MMCGVNDCLVEMRNTIKKISKDIKQYVIQGYHDHIRDHVSELVKNDDSQYISLTQIN